MPISEFWVTIGDWLFFSHGAIEQDYFFSQNQSKEFFFLRKKNPKPPPPPPLPQNIKWTVPNEINLFFQHKRCYCKWILTVPTFSVPGGYEYHVIVGLGFPVALHPNVMVPPLSTPLFADFLSPVERSMEGASKICEWKRDIYCILTSILRCLSLKTAKDVCVSGASSLLDTHNQNL